MNPELQKIVQRMVDQHGRQLAASIILAAHNGRLSGPINPANMHLFRRYRNSVSADPFVMLKEAGA